MSSKKKVAKRTESVKKEKRLPANENVESYLQKTPVWAFQHCDLRHPKWSLKNCGVSFFDDILTKLMSFEGLTWAEIQASSGGKRAGNGTNNHFENISELTKDAQKRAKELLLDVDQLFSLRLTATLRLYGILENGVFYVLWCDPHHEIYEMKKK